MSLAFWERLPFAGRLLFTASAALLVAGSAMLYFSARSDARNAAESLAYQMENELRTLPGAMADLLVIGDFSTLQQNLDRLVRNASIASITYHDGSGTQLRAQGQPVPVHSPAWFAEWLQLYEMRGSTDAMIGGRSYGSFEIILTTQHAINRTWSRLLQHLSILALAIVLDFLGIWLVLRLGLKPLDALDAGSQALAEGDFSKRIEPQGSPELRHVITAFNHMAAHVEGTVEKLAASEGRLSAILQSIGDGLIATDTVMRISYLNPIAETLTGWTQAEAAGRPVAEIFNIIHALSGHPAEIPVGRVLETGRVVGLANHTMLIARDGRRLHIADSAAPIRDANGELVGVVMVFRDVTESYHLRSALEESRGRLELALKGADLGLWDWNVATGDVIYDNRWASMLGYRLQEIEPHFSTWERLIHPDDASEVRHALDQHLSGNSPQYESEVRMRAKNGEWRWILTRGRITERDAQGAPLRVSGTHLDITERKRAQAEIERLAYYDPLTGMPNRRLLLDRLQHELASARRAQNCGALLFIDLDYFKHLNDAYGHAVGDLLLQEVARRLVVHVREDDTVARLGGDEFVVLLVNLGSSLQSAANHARSVAEKLREAMGRIYQLAGHEHYIGSSIGVSLFPEGEDEGANEILRHADTAMYRAKEAGRNAICFFEPDMQAAVEARLVLERDLREALLRDQLRLYLQPQLNADGQVVAAESLLRWEHPSRGLVPPMAFIPLAEEVGLIVSMGQWVLSESCQLIRHLEQQGHDIRIAVNVSPRQFREADFVAQVRQALHGSGASPQRLTLEITEGMLLDNVEETIQRMSELVDLGVRFSIDDFGTGYSSLAYIKRLPLHELKIDRSFVSGLPDGSSTGSEGEDAAVLVETILGMARQLRMTVVAEGVESDHQLAFLRQRGCQLYQGYLFSRPLPADGFLLSLGKDATA